MENLKLNTLPEEKILLIQRKSFNILLPSIFAVFFFFAISIILAYFIFLVFFSSLILFISAVLTSTSLTLTFLIKQVTDWYFQVYVVTSKRIAEISTAPLFSHKINGVLLDQVRCTEIDVEINGTINQILDIGKISLTFDRPTHQEEFIINGIKNPSKVGAYIQDLIEKVSTGDNKVKSSKLQWFTDRTSKRPRLIEIFPKERVSLLQ
ncbi:hypothetical protein KKG52_00330 [Patescibacteria group bacterium]|nr:hypothetical protein [Patescibacteria group bacterium]